MTTTRRGGDAAASEQDRAAQPVVPTRVQASSSTKRSARRASMSQRTRWVTIRWRGSTCPAPPASAWASAAVGQVAAVVAAAAAPAPVITLATPPRAPCGTLWRTGRATCISSANLAAPTNPRMPPWIALWLHRRKRETSMQPTIDTICHRSNNGPQTSGRDCCRTNSKDSAIKRSRQSNLRRQPPPSVYVHLCCFVSRVRVCAKPSFLRFFQSLSSYSLD